MKNEERINIRVVLHDLLSKPAKRIREEQQAIKESAEEASKAQQDLGDALDKSSESMEKYRKVLNDSTGATEESIAVGKRQRSSLESGKDAIEAHGKAVDEHGQIIEGDSEATDENSEAVKKNEDTVKKGTKSRRKSNDETKRGGGILTRVGKQVQKTGRGMLGFSSNYLTFLGMFRGLVQTDLAPAIPVLLTGITTLGAGVIAMVGPMSQLGANVAHLLPLYATMGTLMAVTTMAFSGFGDALEVLNDPTSTIEEINEALGKLGPNAQKAVRVLSGVSKSFSAITGAVQENYWGGGMTEALQNFTDKYLPILQTGLINASSHMRDASIYAMELFGGKKEQNAFARVLAGSGRSAGKIGIALAEVGRVLLFITDSAMPVFEDFLTYVATSFHNIGNNLDPKAMRIFFEDAGRMAKGFWDGLLNIGGALRNMAKASKPLTDYLTKGLGDILQKWNDWTGSDEGQKQMTEFFKSMIPNFKAIGDLVVALWDMFGDLGNSEWFAPFVEDIAKNVIPTLSKMIGQLSDNLLPVFIEVSKAFGRFSEGQDITVVQPLIDIVTAVGTAIAWIFNNLANLPTGLKDFFTYLGGLSLIGVPVAGAIWFITKRVWGLVGGFKFLWSILKIVFKIIGSAFSLMWNFAKLMWSIGKAVFGGLGKAFGAIGRFISPVLGWIGRLAGKVGFGGLMRVLGFFGKRLVAVAGGPVGIIIGALWLIWDALKLLYDKVGWFRDGVDTAVNWVKTVWQGFTNWIVETAFPAVVGGILGLIAWFKSIPTKVNEAILVVRAIWQAVVDWFNGYIVGSIAGFVGSVVAKFVTMRDKVSGTVAKVREKWQSMVDWLKVTIVEKISGFAISAVSKFNKVKTGVNNLIDKARTKWREFTDWLKTSIVERIAGFAVSAVAKFVNVRTGVSNMISKMREKWNSLMTWLKTTIVEKVAGFVFSAVAKFNKVKTGVNSIIDKVKEKWRNLVDWLKTTIVDRISNFVTKAVEAFDRIGGGVRTAMAKIRDASSKPVDFVVNTVYNNGIRKMWNKVADTFKLNTLPTVSFGGGGGGKGGSVPNNRYATGGVLPGYTPGQDVHHFTSPTGGNLHLSGGEAIMRPEFTKSVGGVSGVNNLNKLAINGRLNQAFAGGGVIDFAGDLAGKAWDKTKKVGSSLANGAKNVASAIGGFVSNPLDTITNLVKKPAEALYGSTPNGDSTFGKGMLQAPKLVIQSLIDKAKNKVHGWFKPNEMEGGGGGGLGKVHMGAPPEGGSWVRPSAGPITQRYGVPGVLSGLAHAGTDIAGGGKTYSAGAGTVYATGSGILGGRSGLGIGISHGGGIFTYYGHNPVGGIQVSPGQKVKAGQHIGYQGSTGNVTGTHLHFELHKGGWGHNVNPSAVGVYDTGGWLMPGQMAMNMSNSPEPILNGEQFGWLRAMATNGADGAQMAPQHISAGGGTTIIHEGDKISVSLSIESKDDRDAQELARLINIELKKIKQQERERK